MVGACPEEAARFGGPADRAEIEALAREARQSVVHERGGAALLGRDHPPSAIEASLGAALNGAQDAIVIVGTLDDMIVGFMLARALDTEGSGRVAALEGLWVTPEARQVGVGEAMMGQLVAWARAASCDELDAEALPGDRDTKNFYETHGLVAREIKVSRPLG